VKLKIQFLIIWLCGIQLISAVEPVSTPYGAKGEFEISAGVSGSYSANSIDFKSYGINVIPYANHFLFNHLFLRYQAGLGYQYFGSYIPSSRLFIYPGIALGYSFNLSPNWAFNISGGYLVFYAWELNSSSYNLSGGSQYTSFHPEIKYLITDKWLISFLMEVRTNLHDFIISSRATASVATTGSIVASYRL